MKSSSMELGTEGMRAAMMYANDAHAAYSDSLRSHWVDATLAEAALVSRDLVLKAFVNLRSQILALFESSAHPEHTDNRATNALLKLDEIIMSITLTNIDQHDHDVCRFSPNTVPMVLFDGGSDIYSDDRRCACFPSDAIEPPNPHKHRNYILPWDNTWSPDQIRDEEIRRLCWSALGLVSEYIAQCEAFNEEPPRFYLSDPSNVSNVVACCIFTCLKPLSKFALLFPGEVLDRVSPTFRASDSISPKSRFGPCTVEACCSGTSAIVSVNPVKRRRELSKPTKHSLKFKLLRIPSTFITAISTRR